MNDLDRLFDILRDEGEKTQYIQGILCMGSCLSPLRPNICLFNNTSSLSGADPKVAYKSLRANHRRHSAAPADVDIWLLVEGSPNCPTMQDVARVETDFLDAVVARKFLNAEDLGVLKGEHVARIYKQRRFYTKPLADDEEPWLARSFSQSISELVALHGLDLPVLECRAYPETVFHVRPQVLTDGLYFDRLPMVHDLADYIGDKTEYEIVYSRDQACIWPFAKDKPNFTTAHLRKEYAFGEIGSL